ncbi:glycosyltransferase family 4 protein [Falsiroseomonas oryziterrae]|uniref:glycosyltransferase family 4 protein n=1 Tax=Falsiroseomonas oryziterrae TaxID=2911368 RepID=UPI001F360905|nr:glycosyltransferase family 1 protein [Roseomonas sp. NPKOSM-4]
MKPLIAIDGYNLALEQGTGVATYARGLSRRLQALGAEVGVLYGHRSSSGRDGLLREVTFFDPRGDLPGWRRPLDDFLRMIRLRRGVDAVEVPIGSVETAGLEARLPAFDRIWNVPSLYRAAVLGFGASGRFGTVRLPGAPAVMHWTYPVPLQVPGVANIYTIHDLVPLRLPFTTLDNKKRYLGTVRGIAERAAHIVTVSEASKRDIMSLLGVPEERVTNAGQAVELPDRATLKPDALVRGELEGFFGLEWGRYFLFFGAIEPKKNVGRLIEAYLASGSEHPLVICGKQAWNAHQELGLLYEDDRRDFVPRGPIEGVQGMTRRLRDKVVLINYVPGRLLTGLIRGARAMLFPSLYEGFGLPVIEAMHLGTPVMTSNSSSLPEVAGDAALLVDPYDTRAMAEAIQALDRDEALRARLAALGPPQAASFSTERYALRLRDLYARLGIALDGPG